MANVNLTIDGRSITVPAGTTILQAAKQNDIRIPTLCFLEKLEPHASCRMCMVEVEGARTFQHACAAKVKEGMVVHTDTEAVRASRKLTLQLLLSDHNVDCHHCLRIGSSKCEDLDPWFCESCFFCDCEKEGFCELQALAREYGVDALPFEQIHGQYPLDASTVIVRNPNKCIKCKRCVDVCGNVQTVHNLASSGRGCEVVIGPAFGRTMAESACIGCGRCVEVCPTAAIHVKEQIDEMLYYAHQYGTESVCMIEENVVPEIERLYRLDPGTITTEHLAASLKKMGFDHVYSAEGALTQAKTDAARLLEEKLGNGPVILAQGEAAKQLMEREEKDANLALYPSAMAVFAQRMRQEKPDAKRTYISAFSGNDKAAAETGDVDFCVNTHEFYRILMRTGGAPHRRTPVALESLEAEACSDYADILADTDWAPGGEPEEIRFRKGKKTYKGLLCRNPAQLRDLEDQRNNYDVIRVIV